jgi:hypothetical protein
MQHADLFPVEGFKRFTGATLSIRRIEYDIEREIKALGQSGLPRPDWIAKTLLAAPQNDIAYTRTTCSTGATPTPQSSAANTMHKPCSPTWQAFTPTQLHKPGNKN